MAAVVMVTPRHERFSAAKHLFLSLGIPRKLYRDMRASLFRRGTLSFELKGVTYRVDAEK
jgi:hypothetical protein